MFVTDQAVRHNYVDSPSVKNSYLWNRCDSINAKSVDSIIVSRGIISTREFGYKTASNFFILFDHLPDSLVLNRMPLVEAMLKSKGMGKTYYAMIKDRSLVYEKKEQLYGTQFHFDTTAKSNRFFPIHDIENVDKQRKKAGLTKLKFYAELYKVLLPKGYLTQ
jgi:hypothetical protein